MGSSVPAPSPPAAINYSQDTVVGTVGSAVVVARASVFDWDCPPLEAAGILVRFVGGIAEDPQQTLALVGTGFMWYSMGEHGPPQRHVSVHGRETFRELLNARTAQHERQRMTAVALRPDGNFEMLGARVADDLPASGDGPVRATRGKGRVDCASRTVVALSLVVEGAAGRHGEFEELDQLMSAGVPPELLRESAARAIAELSRPAPAGL
jgi:hypothetical protein